MRDFSCISHMRIGSYKTVLHATLVRPKLPALSMSSTFCTTTLLLLALSCRTGSLLIVIPTDLTVEAPGRAVIECHYSVCPGLQWQGPAIGNDGHYTINNERTTTSLLTINPLREEDEGEYYCTCTDGRRAGPSYLLVNHPPSIEGVERNQTFHRGETARVLCEANRGDPQRELIWIHNGHKVLSGDQQLRVGNGNSLIIKNINDRNEGIYQCVVITANGPLMADITVNVIAPPPEPTDVLIDPNLPHSLSIEYGQPLSLDCRNPSEESDADFSWLGHDDGQISSSNLLEVDPLDITPGIYRCLASVPGDREQHTVRVMLVNTPPICSEPDNHVTISAMELEDYYLRKELMFELERNDINISWTKSSHGEMVDYDFGSRFTYTINEKTLRLHIKRADLTDNGYYEVNISNPYGHAMLGVNVNVIELTRTSVQVQIQGYPCNLIQEHNESFADQIANKHACSVCGRVRVDNLTLSCDGDTATLMVTLLSQDELPDQERSRVSLRLVSGETIEASICTGQRCPIVQPQEEDNTLVISIVVSVLITISVLLLVLLATFLVRRIHFCQRHKQRVGQEERGPEQPPAPVVVVRGDQRGAEPECIGYASVNKPPSQVHRSAVDPTATPVTLPYAPQPLHMAPLPLPSSANKAKRPDKLYFRSHSYHGSTRTPQA